MRVYLEFHKCININRCFYVHNLYIFKYPCVHVCAYEDMGLYTHMWYIDVYKYTWQFCVYEDNFLKFVVKGNCQLHTHAHTRVLLVAFLTCQMHLKTYFHKIFWFMIFQGLFINKMYLVQIFFFQCNIKNKIKKYYFHYFFYFITGKVKLLFKKEKRMWSIWERCVNACHRRNMVCKIYSDNFNITDLRHSDRPVKTSTIV